MHPAEAYILSRFRNKGFVEALVVSQGIPTNAFDSLVRLAVVDIGLDAAGYSADVYKDAFGTPLYEEVLRLGDTTLSFAGSIRSVYEWKLFKYVLFAVNQHPDGYAWGETFIQGRLPASYIESYQVEPFVLVKDVLVRDARTASHELFDGWGRSEDIIFESHDDCGSLRAYYAEFDYCLLQTWKPQDRGRRRPVPK